MPVSLDGGTESPLGSMAPTGGTRPERRPIIFPGASVMSWPWIVTARGACRSRRMFLFRQEDAMKMRTAIPLCVMLLGIAGIALAGVAALSPNEQLGKSIFFDDNLSLNLNQSCAACHAPEVGFTGPLSFINAAGSVYEGSVAGRFGARKPPSAAYATPSPIFHFVIDKKEPLFIGGNFWDGRATGDKLGNPAADQAQGPFLNPVEQALTDFACVVYRVCDLANGYPVSFQAVWGVDSCDITWPPDADAVCATEGGILDLSTEDREKASAAYDQAALSIAGYEDSTEVNAYSSKYDAVLAGLAEFTKAEKKGFNLFQSKGKCANCHILDKRANGDPALLTDFTFDNLGVPKNPDNPVYNVDPDFVDFGLGGFLATLPEIYEPMVEDNLGKHKVPTLRNVAKAPDPGFVKAFGHNGYFKSLWQIVHFYNTRDAKPTCPNPFTTAADAIAMDCWPAPEVMQNVNTGELGNLHLSPSQEDDLVEFMKTLDDGYMP
jgi:cytochrome c peroxidase